MTKYVTNAVSGRDYFGTQFKGVVLQSWQDMMEREGCVWSYCVYREEAEGGEYCCSATSLL